MDLGAQAAGIGALADEIRRRLYELVVAAPDAVSRDHAAAALDIAPHTAKFHLDRLVDEGLLEVEFRRLSGRSGPGAGRPSKLYRRADREFTVSLPPRQYDVVGAILAGAVAKAQGGRALDEALEETAHEAGVELARSAGSGEPAGLEGVARVLETRGYEPRLERESIALANCPFDALAEQHTELVCGLNRSYVQGVGDGLGGGVRACLEPQEGRCCVRVRPADTALYTMPS